MNVKKEVISVKNHQKTALTFYFDGLEFSSDFWGSYSVRVSNIPGNLTYMASPFILLGCNLLGVGAQVYHFDTDSNQHYLMWLRDEVHPRMMHVWNVFQNSNLCNTSIPIYIGDNNWCRPNQYRGYVYDRILEWPHAELWQRWLEPANKSLESCLNSSFAVAISKIEEIAASTTAPNIEKKGDSSLIWGLGLFAASITCAFFYNRAPSKTPYLGKSNNTTPSFSERIEVLSKKMLALGLEELIIPEEFRCPLFLGIMNDPILLDDGMIYDRHAIEQLLIKVPEATCPHNRNLRIDVRPYPTIFNLKNRIVEYITALEKQYIQDSDENSSLQMVFKNK